MRVRRKLYGPRGTLLGTVTYPGELDDHLIRHGAARFGIMPRVAITRDLAAAETVVPDIQVGELVWHWGESGAVRLYGITLEQWEAIPGHSFAPGAAYLRSIVEGGA